MVENSFFPSAAAFCFYLHCFCLHAAAGCCCCCLLMPLTIPAYYSACLMLPIACCCVIPHSCNYDHTLESLCITNHPPCSLTQQDLFRPNLALKHEEVVPQNKGPHQLGAAKKEKKVVSSSAIPTHQGSTKDFRALELVDFHCTSLVDCIVASHSIVLYLSIQ